jgi:phage baseplate assembly protein gpV/phage protein D
VNPVTVHAPVITVDGKPLSAVAQLISIRVELGVCVVGRATLRFVDPGFTVAESTTFKVGNTVKIAMPDSGSEPIMMGTVTGISLEHTESDQPELTVIVDDATYKLTRGTHVATYVKSTAADVVRTVCSRAGLRVNVSNMPAGVHEYLLQAGTDLAFINTIMERTGCVWWMEGLTTFTVGPARSPHGDVTLPADDGLLSFRVRASGLMPTSVKVTGWDRDGQQEIVGTSRVTSPVTSALLTTYVSSSGPLSSATSSAADQNPTSAAEADRIATALHDEWQSGAVVAEGVCLVNDAIRPMTKVTIAGLGPASGDYLVSEVEHVYSASGFTTRFVCGPQRHGGLVGTLGVPMSDAGFSAQSLVVGHVTNVNDEDKYGRVKVTYNGIDGQIESAWARIVTLGAGNQRGITFQPEVGDEVLVGFERGDTRHPIVLGGLYSKRTTMGETGVEGNRVVHRRLTSRLGHVVELADGDGPADQHILLRLGKPGHRLRLGADRFDLELEDGKPLTIAAGRAKITFDSQGNITIHGMNVTIEADQAVAVKGQSKAELKATGQVGIEGAQVAVKASAMGSVEAGGVLALKGSAVAIN